MLFIFIFARKIGQKVIPQEINKKVDFLDHIAQCEAVREIVSWRNRGNDISIESANFLKDYFLANCLERSELDDTNNAEYRRNLDGLGVVILFVTLWCYFKVA